jgi:hypothetical protein
VYEDSGEPELMLLEDISKLLADLSKSRKH